MNSPELAKCRRSLGSLAMGVSDVICWSVALASSRKEYGGLLRGAQFDVEDTGKGPNELYRMVGVSFLCTVVEVYEGGSGKIL